MSHHLFWSFLIIITASGILLDIRESCVIMTHATELQSLGFLCFNSSENSNELMSSSFTQAPQISQLDSVRMVSPVSGVTPGPGSHQCRVLWCKVYLLPFRRLTRSVFSKGLPSDKHLNQAYCISSQGSSPVVKQIALLIIVALHLILSFVTLSELLKLWALVSLFIINWL